MSKRKPKSPAQLPQRQEIWYVDTERMRTWVENDAGATFRPHMVLIANGTTGMIMNTEMLEAPALQTDLLQSLTDLIHGRGQLMRTTPYKPTHVYFRAGLLSDMLTTELGNLAIQVQVVDRPPEIDDMLAQMTSMMFDEENNEIPGLLAVEGVTPEFAAAFFAAAADFYRTDPWFVLTDEMPLVIDVSGGGGKRFAVVMGAGGIEYGLAVYNQWADFERMFEFADNPLATLPAEGSHSLLFGDITGLPFDDMDALEEFGWDVADEDAYPLPVIIQRDAGVSRPSLADLRWYEAALRAIPRFVEQHEETLADFEWDDEEPVALEETYQVQTASGMRDVRIVFPAGPLPAGALDRWASDDLPEMPPELAAMLQGGDLQGAFAALFGELGDEDDDFDDDDFDDDDLDDGPDN